MRIVSGRLRGRVFDSPGAHHTHPMSEKVRGALFNALGDISGLSVLDAFAGSGALGFEAISRGAAHATLLDIDKRAITTVVKSAQVLAIGDQIRAIKVNATAWLTTQPEAQFDIVLCDPPYDNLQPNLLRRLADRTKPHGIVVLSLPPNTDFILPASNFHLLSSKAYGDAELAFYRRIG